MPQAKKPKKAKRNIKSFVIKKKSFYSNGVLILILTLGLVATLYVSKQSQDTRGRAGDGGARKECLDYFEARSWGIDQTKPPGGCIERPEIEEKGFFEELMDIIKGLVGVE